MSQNSVFETQKITWLGLAINIGLSALKMLFGVLGRSNALIADAVHSLSDLVTDFAVLIGVKFWSKPPDARHPYGHRRIETLVSAAIGLALLLVAVGLAYDALAQLQSEVTRQPQWIALYGALLSILFKEALYRWTAVTARRIKSPAVMANAWHHRTDALSSIPVAIAIAAAAINPDWAFIDPIGAFVVSLFIMHAAWKITHPALSELIDEGASEGVNQQIADIAMAVPGVESVHAIRARRMGAMLHIDLHVMVDPQMSVLRGHEISHIVKSELLKQGPDVADVIIHLEPFGGSKN